MNPQFGAVRAANKSPVRREKEKLQGAWTFVSGSREALLLIAGNHFAVTFKHGAVYMGRYKLDPKAAPKRIDVSISEGPERHRGKTSLGIYELDGDQLRWCPAAPGEERLKAFPAASDPKHLHFTFKRERP